MFRILALIFIIMAGKMIYEIKNYYRVAKDTEPIMLFSTMDNALYSFYLQRNMDTIEMPLNIETLGKGVLNAENRDEILTIQYGEGIAKYDYVQDEVEGLLTYEEKDQITGGGVPEQLHFIPGGNSISFCVENKIYTYNFDNSHYEEVYEYNRDFFYKLEFSYKWKNSSEMYLIESDNLILYNIDTKEKEVVYEGLGKCYFHMSQGGEYLIYQAQRGKKREIVLLNMETGERKTIYKAKSDNKVNVAFSPDKKYIFFVDINPNSLFDPQYWYLYDIKKDRKYSVDIGDKPMMLVGWD